MPIRKKILFLLALITIVTFLVNCSSVTSTEDKAYLTPIPESTWSAYREIRPINNRFDAVLEASQEIHHSRLTFTQGAPIVVFTEEMTLTEAKKLIPEDPGEVYSSEDRPADSKVWLVIFEAQWQILPPMSNDLLPLETGCIYAIIDANDVGFSRIRATSCQAKP
ncbi:MAG: hypothetical protein ABIU06_04990 [Anaerolineales bacterium]